MTDFQGGDNIAMKVPSYQYAATVAFYAEVLGLLRLEEELPAAVFEFGGKRLWIDGRDDLSHAEIWLELRTTKIAAAAEHMAARGVVRRDEVERLPEGFAGFWICNPAGIIHLVSAD